MDELSEPLQKFVNEPNVAVLATLRKDGSPHLTSVWYAYEDGEIKIVITPRRLKYAHVKRDPRVSLAVTTNTAPYKQVIFEGKAQVTAEGGEDLMYRLSIKYYGEEDGKVYADYDMDMDTGPGGETRLVLHYKPERIIAFDFSVEDDYHRPWGSGYDVKF